MESDKDNFETKLQESISNPKNMGEMKDADAIGTVGNADCGDMVRMFLKFDEENGQKVINKASFQSFGCQTAIAVASMATEILKGKTIGGNPYRIAFNKLAVGSMTMKATIITKIRRLSRKYFTVSWVNS